MTKAWKQNISDAVTAKAAETVTRSAGSSATANISRVGFSQDAHPFIVRAAKLRGISISGYIRRSTAAMAALDLGIDPQVIFEKDSAIAKVGGQGRWAPKDLDGAIYGRWDIQRADPPDTGAS